MSVALYRQPNTLPGLSDPPTDSEQARYRAELDAMYESGQVSGSSGATTIADVLRLAAWFGWTPPKRSGSDGAVIHVGLDDAAALSRAIDHAVALGRRLGAAPVDEHDSGAYWKGTAHTARWTDPDGIALLLLVDEDGLFAIAEIANFARGGGFSVG